MKRHIPKIIEIMEEFVEKKVTTTTTNPGKDSHFSFFIVFPSFAFLQFFCQIFRCQIVSSIFFHHFSLFFAFFFSFFHFLNFSIFLFCFSIFFIFFVLFILPCFSFFLFFFFILFIDHFFNFFIIFLTFSHLGLQRFLHIFFFTLCSKEQFL